MAVLLGLSLSIFLHRVGNSDIFWQLKTGQMISETGLPSGEDPFSFTMQGAKWIDQEWISELVLYEVESVFGFEGLSYLSLTLGFFLSLVIFFGLLKISDSPSRVLIYTSVVLLLSAFRLQLMRPELFGYIYFSLFIAVLMRVRAFSLSVLFFLMILQVVWVNTHSSAILGPVVVFIFGFKKHWLFVASFLLLISMMLNPFGIDVLTYPLEHLTSHGVISRVSDWKGPGIRLSDMNFAAVGSMMMAVLALSTMIWKRRAHPPLIMLALASLAGGLFSARFLPFAIISLAFLMCCIASRPSRDLDASEMKKTIALAAILITFVAVPSYLGGISYSAGLIDGRVIFTKGEKLGVGLAGDVVPYEAVQFIMDNDLKGRMLNDMAFGGYLIYEMWPGRDVFMDTRTQVYGEEFINEYVRALFDEKAFDSTVRQYGISYVIYDTKQIKAVNGPLQFMRGKEGWKVAYTSEKATIFVRNDV